MTDLVAYREPYTPRARMLTNTPQKWDFSKLPFLVLPKWLRPYVRNPIPPHGGTIIILGIEDSDFV